MDENNTTPETNLPDETENNKPEDSFFGKKRNMFGNFENNYKNNKPKAPDHHDEWFYDKRVHPEHVKAEPTGAYEEIVDDLIDIISKLLKELSKRK
jgi:hypothetical protein